MKRIYTVALSNDGSLLDTETFSFDDQDDLQNGGAAAREVAIRMIRDAGYLRPGDCIRVLEEGRNLLDGLVDVRAMSRLNPVKFPVPWQRMLPMLRAGDSVKVCRNEERFWIELTEIAGERLWGKVSNTLMLNPDLPVGTLVHVQWTHVYQTMPGTKNRP